jgi:Protein of unknown function (DUF3500)
VTADALTRAVSDWLASLDDEQRRDATFDFDDRERSVWAFTPGERGGLALRDMRAEQRVAAMRVVDAAMSARGAHEVAEVMALESILGAIERDKGRSIGPRRDPELYWFAVFGEPGIADPWMWRVGGHHVAVAMTVADGGIIGSSPSFLGANPAVVPAGPRAGFRVLTGEEALARDLLAVLAPTELATVVVDANAPPEILTSNAARADPRSVPRGLMHAEMSEAGRAGLERLIRYYLDRSATDLADEDWTRAVAEGLPDTTFAWAGSTEPRHGHYYAIRGPRLLIEYDNTQNGANHIHAVRRDLANDWGEDLLAEHYRSLHRA